MAYRYNERTGEFEDIPQEQPRRVQSPSSTQSTRVDARTPHVPTRTTGARTNTSYSPSPSTSSSSKFGDFLTGVGALLLNILPYVLISLAISTCN